MSNVFRSAVANWSDRVPPGSVVAAHGDQLRVAAGSEALDLLEIQPEGKRPMSPRDFLAGQARQLSGT